MKKVCKFTYKLKDMEKTIIEIEQIIKELKNILSWRNDYQRVSDKGDFRLLETVGVNDSKFTLYFFEGDDMIEVKSWKE